MRQRLFVDGTHSHGVQLFPSIQLLCSLAYNYQEQYFHPHSPSLQGRKGGMCNSVQFCLIYQYHVSCTLRVCANQAVNSAISQTCFGVATLSTAMCVLYTERKKRVGAKASTEIRYLENGC